MACGTGKTFTSLKLAEEQVGAGGKVLFLVPSISLLSQTVREWVSNADLPIRPLAVCSDPKSTRRTSSDTLEDISVTDLALPATTDVAVLASRLKDAEADDRCDDGGLLDVPVDRRRRQGTRRTAASFELIVCDEAHRTTGATLAGEDESAFVRVHDNDLPPGHQAALHDRDAADLRRLHQDKAGEANAVLASMDDETSSARSSTGSGSARPWNVDLLTDYKVLVLTVDEEVGRPDVPDAAVRRQQRAQARRRCQDCWLLEWSGQARHN